MSAIYHILKNGVVQAVTTLNHDTGYFHGYNEHLKQTEKGNPESGSPLPSGNWRGGGSKVAHITAGGKGKK